MQRQLKIALILLASIPFIQINRNWAQQVKKTSEIEGVSEYRLANGCRVLLVPDQSKPVVTVNMTVLVGSRHEGYGETGMAHLLEHLMFKGTPTNRNIPQAMKDRGAVNFNGTTWYDRTNYYETLPASEENLKWAISLEADRLVNSFISGEDLASEMTVVRNEFERGENDPRRILLQRIMSAAYEWHNYGKMTIGNRADIERVPINSLRQFYEKYYRVDNIVLTIAGKFDEKQALALVEESFGNLVPPSTSLPETYTQEPVQDGERSVMLRRTGDVQLVGAGYHVPAASSPDFAAVEVLSNVLGMRPSGRLYKNLVETKLASRVNSMEIAGHDPGMLLCFAEVPSNVPVESAREALLKTVESVANTEISDAEVRRATAELLKQRDDLVAETESLAVELSDWAAYGDWRLFFLHRDRLESVTPADVKRVAEQYLVPSNRTVGVFIPETNSIRARIAESPSIESMLADYRGREKLTEGEAFDPSPDNIEQRLKRGRLASGMKYALLPKKNKGETVSLTLNLRFGNEDDLRPTELNTASDLLADCMVRGTRQLDHQQIEDRLRELKSTLNQSSQAGEAQFSLESRRSQLAPALDVLRQILREPSFPEAEFEIVRRQQITQIESRRSEPTSLGMESLLKHLMPYPPSDVRYIPTFDEQIERLNALTNDNVKSTYQFLNGDFGELVIVGDFDSESILPILEGIFQDWHSESEYRYIDSSVQSPPKAESIEIQTPDKANAMYAAGVALPIRDDDERFESMFVGNNILGGGALSNRLANRVRQQEGLSYTIGSRFSAESLEARASFMTFAIMNPENRARLNSAIREEFDRILDGGVTVEELEKAKSGLLEQMRASRSDDSNLSAQLLRQLAADRNMDFVKRREARIQGLTKEAVDSALREMIDRQHLIEVNAGDFKSPIKSAEPAK